MFARRISEAVRNLIPMPQLLNAFVTILQLQAFESLFVVLGEIDVDLSNTILSVTPCGGISVPIQQAESIIKYITQWRTIRKLTF
jgi:hypothetical protein